MTIYYANPFRHWIIEGFADPPKHAPLPDGPWARYSNDCEKGKRTCNAIDRYGPWGQLFGWLLDPFTVEGLTMLTGIDGLQADQSLYGAGLHVTDPGGWLNCHLDYALHTNGMERRLNVVLFLNQEWREEWGGAFELWDEPARAVVQRIYPAWNRAVVWEASDLAYHGTQALTHDAPPRITAACYYLAPARPGCVRKRALFVPCRA